VLLATRRPESWAPDHEPSAPVATPRAAPAGEAEPSSPQGEVAAEAVPGADRPEGYDDMGGTAEPATWHGPSLLLSRRAGLDP
jgi:hypothetical protein